MPLVSAICTQCGGQLKVDSKLEAAVCNYCNAPFIIEKAINKYNINNNITGSVVNIYGGNVSDFVIRAGGLIKYNGAAINVVVPDTVTYIVDGTNNDSAFGQCKGLKSVILPEGLSLIGDYAFNDCISLETINIPDNVQRIGKSAFNNCVSLKDIKIGNVNYIDDFAFCNCRNITTVNLNNYVEKIGYKSFFNCAKLLNVDYKPIFQTNDPVIFCDYSFKGTPFFSKLLNQQINWVSMGRCKYCGSEIDWRHICKSCGNQNGLCVFCGGYIGFWNNICKGCGKIHDRYYVSIIENTKENETDVKFCKNCGKEVRGKYCLGCGTECSKQQAIIRQTTPLFKKVQGIQKSKKPIYKKWWFWVIIVVIMGSMTENFNNNNSSDDNIKKTSASVQTENYNSETNISATVESPNTESSKTETIKEDLTSVAKEYILTAGYYTAGIDIPAGKCNVTAISGTGNLSSSNMFTGGINAMFGIDDGTGLYTSSFNGLKFPSNTTLSLNRDLKIKLVFTSVDSNYTGRTYDESAAIIFTDGNYESGIDFTIGIYKVVAVSGTGNLSSSNIFDGGINEMFGVDDGSGFFNDQFLNANLEKGVTLSISGGLTVKLIPAK